MHCAFCKRILANGKFTDLQWISMFQSTKCLMNSIATTSGRYPFVSIVATWADCNAKIIRNSKPVKYIIYVFCMSAHRLLIIIIFIVVEFVFFSFFYFNKITQVFFSVSRPRMLKHVHVFFGQNKLVEIS